MLDDRWDASRQGAWDPLSKERASFQPPIPKLLENASCLIFQPDERVISHKSQVQASFPHLSASCFLQVMKDEKKEEHSFRPLRVGILLSGGPAPGGHNVIAGLLDALLQIHPQSQLIGFLDGYKGLLENNYELITTKKMAPYRNMGGFDLLGSGRIRIQTIEQIADCKKHVQAHQLDGLIIVGGDDSNTNAAILAEAFASSHLACSVVGVPKTIDNDLTGNGVDLSFGHDTACRVYSELIAGVARDCVSSKKYYHFIRLMGRSASHITLECALQTHPTWAFLGEEILKEQFSFEQLCQTLAQLILTRAQQSIRHGIILVPEGLIEFIPQFRSLLEKMSSLKVVGNELTPDQILALGEEAKLFFELPSLIQRQLLMHQDAHGNLKLASIATEELLMERVKTLVEERGESVEMVSHYFGYEARAVMPTDFDASYTYALGIVAALLVKAKANGFMAAIEHLHLPVEAWQGMGVPITSFIHFEKRQGQSRPVIAKTLVDLDGGAFQYFASHRHEWAKCDSFRFAGPIQYFGPSRVRSSGPLALKLKYDQSIEEII